MKKVLLVIAAVFAFCAHTFGQLHPDKLVLESDATTIDSLKNTDYPYLFPIWGDKVQKMGITMPLSAGLGVNYLWQESDLNITDLTVGFNDGPMTDLSEIIRITVPLPKPVASTFDPTSGCFHS